jgi:hypothetical protein
LKVTVSGAFYRSNLSFTLFKDGSTSSKVQGKGYSTAGIGDAVRAALEAGDNE